MAAEPLSFDDARPIMVNIEQLVSSQDSYGAPSTSWTPFASNVPMALVNDTGDERYGDQQIEALDRWIAGCRYIKGVNEKMRLNFTRDSRQYLLDITSVAPRNGWRWLVIRAKSGVNRG
jgi:hypothetical protein